MKTADIYNHCECRKHQNIHESEEQPTPKRVDNSAQLHDFASKSKSDRFHRQKRVRYRHIKQVYNLFF